MDSQHQFWHELDALLDEPLATSSYSREKLSHGAIASSIQRFLALADAYYDQHLDHDANRTYAVKRLLGSDLFSSANEGFAAECIVEQLRKATSLRTVLVCYDVILLYGSHEPAIYRIIQTRIKDILFRLVHQIWAGLYATHAEEKLAAEEAASQGASKVGQSLHFEYARRAAFDRAEEASKLEEWHRDEFDASRAPPKLVTTPLSGLRNGEGSSASIMRRLQISLRSKAVRMMYEVCRVQKLDNIEMRPLDRRFLDHLFDLVEETREHADDSFNYQLIKLIVAINEQYMVAGFANGTAPPLPNVVLEAFRTRLDASKTFGENLIFMLNRASGDAEDICMQLLVLKLLYLLFTTEDTAHYFYTNDLKVLVDVFIRELSDLPEESESLRHTYLRVLHPLLTNTQLREVPYKRPQIRRLLLGLISLGHIRDVSPTTKRLVDRCLRADWCIALDQILQDGPAVVPSSSGEHEHLAIAVAKIDGAEEIQKPAPPPELRYPSSNPSPQPEPRYSDIQRSSNTPSPSPSTGRRRPPPPPVSNMSSPSLTTPASAYSTSPQTLAPVARLPPPINRATKGTKSPSAGVSRTNSPGMHQATYS
ncbi:pre-rRNA processing [Tilletia horrida]|nr:pre-rRNA processing [Tilletia horrida]